MRSLTATQQALLAGHKSRSWLFTIVTLAPTTYRWSTKNKSFDSNTYTAKVLPKSFAGVTLNRSLSELGVHAPNELTFEAQNTGPTLTPSSFEGATVTVNLVLSNATYADTSIMAWKFRVKRCVGEYQKLRFYCEDFLQQYLRGKYPKTKKISALAPSDSIMRDDKACVPVPFGTAYIPLRSVYVAADEKRYYILGPAGLTYTVSAVQSPKEWSRKTTWASGSYTFNQYDKTINGTSYRVLEPIIHDLDADGVPDACGEWKESGYYLDMPCKFTRSDSATMTDPAAIIEFILEDMGVPSADLDTGVGSSFAAASTTYAGWGLTWNGAFTRKEPRQAILARLLSMCHSVLQVTDKIEIKVLSKTSQATITKFTRPQNAGDGTFKASAVMEDNDDSGYVAWIETDTPQEPENHKTTLVSALAAGTTARISSETLDCSWVQNSQSAQRLGTLHFQRKLRQTGRISGETHPTYAALQPDDVITLDDDNYGGNYNVLIERITIKRDLTVEISAVGFAEALLDWSDLSPGAITVAADGTSFWQNMQQSWVTVSPVSGEADFATIEAALAALPPWTRTMRLLRGIHPAPVTALGHYLVNTKGLEIIGDDREACIVRNRPGYDCFRVTDSTHKYRFANFTVESMNTGVSSAMIGVYGTGVTDNHSDVVIEDVAFDLALGNDIGVSGINGQNATLIISRCRADGGHPVILNAYDAITIIDNIFKNSEVGITVYYCTDLNILANKIRMFTDTGIYIYGASSEETDRVEIMNNIIRSVYDADLRGIAIENAFWPIVIGNKIRLIAESDLMQGIKLDYCTDGNVSNNSIYMDQQNASASFGSYGIRLLTASRNVLQGNVIDMVNNRTSAPIDYGIRLNSTAYNNQGGDNLTYNAGVSISDAESGGSNAITAKDV